MSGGSFSPRQTQVIASTQPKTLYSAVKPRPLSVFWLVAAEGSRSTLFPPCTTFPINICPAPEQANLGRRLRHRRLPNQKKKVKHFPPNKTTLFSASSWMWLGVMCVVLWEKLVNSTGVSLMCYELASGVRHSLYDRDGQSCDILLK